ncbi:class I SAM-dependent methyltransferase [Geobacter sp. SVR]|uniref:class I SAM-dependent methyltransferase n=1 Tax=Geobacter sp. SVR TaxID=2495594 RepID=UPI00143EFC1F|nr:class I SAM-dependent methyltransferase [Geobacter sp. SVR]BCS51897.1 cyclopropane-fatty-acyl-phospholipid synthase [Geobacter sp. SVR]GCF87719.1 cyclopropane-fatty-acyl-phospholipid synthase [Geobacter sp. SVR]
MFWHKPFNDFVMRMRDKGIPARIHLWKGTEVDLGHNPRVTIKVPSIKALQHLLNPSLDTLGHAYVEGEIDVEGRIADVVDIAARLAESASEKVGKTSRVLEIVHHTRKIDAEAIAYHYDVSNEFYSLWLDPGMVYSCGYFCNEDDPLEAAQVQKIDRILRKLSLRPGDRLLDIGCGWGALVMRAAEKFGAKAVGITLSRNQYELAKERIRDAGLTDRCEVRLEDYRDVTGKFDRISSVGMFEHVGLNNLRGYFDKIHTLLEDDGIVLNHGITSTDPESGESPWGGGSFIDRYVFPHGALPHISLALKEMGAAGLEPVDVESLRRHYSMTLKHWTERFEAVGDQLRTMVGEKRWRIWRVYLAGCAYGFTRHWISVHQILAVKAGAAVLPLTRDYMRCNCIAPQPKKV